MSEAEMPIKGQLEFDLEGHISESKSIEDHWIPVSKSLPGNEDMMLVTCRTQRGTSNVNRAYYSNGFWHGSGSMSMVVAWMPLPKPYRGE